LEKTLIVTVKQGGKVKAAIGGVIKIIYSIINCTHFFVIKWSPYKEIVKESNLLITAL
jgi:hypothetical protein